jgi:quercetin dioxygenase-like cupin family protein
MTNDHEGARPRAEPTVHVDNDRVRVTLWRFAPGAATGWHRHEHDYVIVPLFDGRLELIGPGGSASAADLAKGVSYFREAGVEHDVINANDFEYAFVETELKERPPGRGEIKP